MFISNDNRGFCLKFENGYNISVQWGKGNYCSNRDKGEFIPEGRNVSATAEMLIFSDDKKKDELLDFQDFDTNIIGWLTSEDIGHIIGLLSTPLLDIDSVNKQIREYFLK
jgi:hypothetical protein